MGSSSVLYQNLSWSVLKSKETFTTTPYVEAPINGLGRCSCDLCQGRDFTGASDTPQPLTDSLDTKIQHRGSGPAQYLGGLNAATTFDSLSDTNSPYIDGLLLGGKWGDSDPDNTITTQLKYYYYETGEISYLQQFSSSPIASESWGDAEKATINQSMRDYEEVANITFSETTNKDDAHIRWSSYLDSPGKFGAAFGPTFAGQEPGDIQVNYRDYYTDISAGSIDPGSFYYITFTHELGHAIGLKHPHDSEELSSIEYPLFPGVTEGGESDRGDNGLNSTPWTVMTYNDASSTETSINTAGDPINLSPGSYAYSGYATNLGALDIAATQYLYGPNTDFATTDDTYELNSNINGFKTIWDNGGIDTISAINATSPTVIDLRNATLRNEEGGGGFISRAGDSFNGYTIAYNTTGTAVIENAIGSASSDRITGNSTANTLDGGSGDDTMAGGDSDDTYVVDSASDIVIEATNEGTDLIQAASSFPGTTFTAAANVEDLTLTDTVANNATGNAEANILTGNSAANSLNGLAANDTIIAGAGNDTIDGGTGSDTIDGGAGDDSMTGGDGDDTYVVDSATDEIIEAVDGGTDLIQAASSSPGTTFTAAANVEDLTLTDTVANNATGNAEANILTGNSAANSLNGLAANDTIIAGAGSDTIDGGAGDDSMTGGTGDDTYVVDSATDEIIEAVDGGTDLIQAASSSPGTTFTAAANVEDLTLTDTVANNATGNAEANTLTGNSAANSISGLAGNDTIIAGAGNDTIDGGAGTDSMTGGDGADEFRLSAGTNTVTDFASGTDKVGIAYEEDYVLEDIDNGTNMTITTDTGVMKLENINQAGFNAETDITVFGAPTPTPTPAPTPTPTPAPTPTPTPAPTPTPTPAPTPTPTPAPTPTPTPAPTPTPTPAPAPTPTPAPAPTPTPTPAPAPTPTPAPAPEPSPENPVQCEVGTCSASNSNGSIEISEQQIDNISVQTDGIQTEITIQEQVTEMTTTVNNQTSIEGGKLKAPLFILNSTNGSPARLILANQATNQARINMEDGTNIVNFANTNAKSPKINGSEGNETIRIKDGSQITGKAKIKLGGDSDTVVIDGIINNATINNGNDDSKDKLKVSSSGVIEGKVKVKNFGREDRLNIDGQTFKYNALQDKELQNELKEIGIAVNLMDSN